jgi:uncharacterized membrane protein
MKCEACGSELEMRAVRRPSAISWLANLAIGAGLSAGLLYFFDSGRGKRRRALIRDQFVHDVSQSRKGADVAVRDARNRIRGSLAGIWSLLKRDDPSDDVLIERVRARLGRCVAHPSSIEVDAADGHISLSGKVLDREHDDLVDALKLVRGVKEIENRLDVHHEAENNSGPQGEMTGHGEPLDLLQDNWSPAVRFVTGAAGCGLMANCLAKRTPGAILMGTAGFGLLMRAATNMELKRVFGLGDSRRGIDLESCITIHAPVEAVFSLLANPENFPRLSESITSVRMIDTDRYLKTVTGPLGLTFHLEEIITRAKPYELLAWKSGSNSSIKYAKTARFHADGDARTQVHLRFTYNPVGGVLTHAAARIVGLDPKTILDDLLMRAKTYLETGRQPHEAAQPTHPQREPSITEVEPSTPGGVGART